MKCNRLALLISTTLMLTGCKELPSNNRAWEANPHGHLRFAATGDPLTLDPRYARDVLTVNAVNNLFEGLFGRDDTGTLVPATAESYTTSQDGLTYTFKLRSARWSNGDLVSSQQFADAWKSQLLPDTPAPNANQLYVLKNGEAVKEGKMTPDQLGVETPDNTTLIVHLERPLPYFKELLASHFFLPVHPNSRGDAIISNGPFMLESWKKNNELVCTKNHHYWDANNVHLEKFSFINLEDRTALQMYEADQIDWAGSPLSLLPQDAIIALKHKQQLRTTPSAGTYWLRINTTKSPLSNRKLRLALAYSIDRAALVKNVVQGGQEAALAVVPPSMGLNANEYIVDDDITRAWTLFQEALEEMKLTIEEFPQMTLLYSTASERNQKIAQAIQQQWKKVFGDKIVLKGNETKSVYQQVGQLDYDIAFGSWFADIDDPSNFLDIFKHKTNAGNNTGWDNPLYTAAMDKSLLVEDHAERVKFLEKAQELLLDDMPVIPLFFGAFNYVKKRNVSGVYLSSLGHLHLKSAFIDEGDVEELEGLE